MANNKTIPTKDADFNVWQETISTAVEENTNDWGLDVSWINSTFKPDCAAWNLAWEKYKNPATRTPLITAAKQQKRTTYEKSLMVIVANLRANTRVTDDERRALGIHIRDTKPTPSPVPTSHPVATIDTSTTMRLGISFRDSATNSAAKPKGVHGAEIKWVIADEPPLIKDLINSSFDTRTPYTLEFTDQERGKTVWIRMRWENTRGEKGEWSDMVNAIIP